MAKKFDNYEVKDVVNLIKYEDPENDYKLKVLKRKNASCHIFTKKDLNKYSDEHGVQIVGRIRKRQRRYSDIKDNETLEEFVERKRKKKIIGVANLIDENAVDTTQETLKYDIKKDKNRHTVGYAWVGGNKFLRVTTFNFLWLLLPILLIGLIVCLMIFPSKDNPVINFEDGVSVPGITQNQEDEVRYAVVVPYNEVITLTSEQKNIPFINPVENDGEYYLSFALYVNGEPFIDKSTGQPYETDAIIPEADKNAVLYNLYDQLDAGTYDVDVYVYVYDFETHEKSEKPPTTLSTTVVIDK